VASSFSLFEFQWSGSNSDASYHLDLSCNHTDD
jgi:hypothetical protein